MVWFKVDDGLHSHRKVLSIPRRDRVAALGLWVIAGSWCADNLTDGKVPDYMLTEWAATTRQARALCVAGMWVEVEGGYLFHEWSHAGRQPTRAEVEENRESERKRKAEWRMSQRLSQRDTGRTDSGTDSGTDAGVPPSVPVGVRAPRPDPTRPSSSTGSQSPNGSHPSGSERLDWTAIKRALGQDEDWARRVVDDILSRADPPPAKPTLYVLAAINAEPQRYQPTPQPPAWADLKDQL